MFANHLYHGSYEHRVGWKQKLGLCYCVTVISSRLSQKQCIGRLSAALGEEAPILKSFFLIDELTEGGRFMLSLKRPELLFDE